MSEQLTLEEQAQNYATMKHIALVRDVLNVIVRELLYRGELHDASRLAPPEVGPFARMTPKLAGLTYGSPEYAAALKELGPALAHHYASNRHHPEFWADGVSGMTLIDLVEMFCDWAAAVCRHADGDLRRSIDINEKRFALSPQLAQILRNTVPLLEGRLS